MKKTLVYLSPERHCSLFDIIVAHDAGADVVIPYNSVDVKDVRDIVYGCCFTRHPRDLGSTGIFVGGYSIEKAEELASEASRVLNNLPAELRVNIALDPNGAYTTASACVAKICSSMDVRGARATVLAGTGPVGVSAARLLAGMGASVRITSRDAKKAERVIRDLRQRNLSAFQVDSPENVASAVGDANIVVSAGPPGVELMQESVWADSKSIRVITDANVVPPYGVEGVSPRDDGKKSRGKTCFGALAIGSLKMRLHQMVIKQMFAERNVLFDLNRIYKLHENFLLR